MSAAGFSLQGLFVTSGCVSVLILLFLPLRPWLRRVVGSQWVCTLWLALLVRLLLPVAGGDRLRADQRLATRWQGVGGCLLDGQIRRREENGARTYGDGSTRGAGAGGR